MKTNAVGILLLSCLCMAPTCQRTKYKGRADWVSWAELGCEHVKSAWNLYGPGCMNLGYVEGKNLLIESRWADGNYDRLPDLATELVGLKVDLILTSGTPGTRAAKSATTTIPIVMVTSGDPVALGLVASLARPGGNITGSSNFAPDLSAKRVELIKEAFPSTQRVGVLFNPDNSINDRNLPAMEQTAKELKLVLQKIAVRSADDFKNAYSSACQNYGSTRSRCQRTTF